MFFVYINCQIQNMKTVHHLQSHVCMYVCIDVCILYACHFLITSVFCGLMFAPLSERRVTTLVNGC